MEERCPFLLLVPPPAYLLQLCSSQVGVTTASGSCLPRVYSLPGGELELPGDSGLPDASVPPTHRPHIHQLPVLLPAQPRHTGVFRVRDTGAREKRSLQVDRGDTALPEGAAQGRGRARRKKEVQGGSGLGWTALSGSRPHGGTHSPAALLLPRVESPHCTVSTWLGEQGGGWALAPAAPWLNIIGRHPNCEAVTEALS